jgi:hypothetical protein
MGLGKKEFQLRWGGAVTHGSTFSPRLDNTSSIVAIPTGMVKQSTIDAKAACALPPLSPLGRGVGGEGKTLLYLRVEPLTPDPSCQRREGRMNCYKR